MGPKNERPLKTCDKTGNTESSNIDEEQFLYKEQGNTKRTATETTV